MLVCDFSRSFLTFRIDAQKHQPITQSHKAALTLNNARIQLDSTCTIEFEGRQTQYLLGVSCKTERCYVDRDIWTEPNADFCPIVSEDRLLLIKRWDRTEKGVMLHPPTLGPQPQRQVRDVAGTWDKLTLQVRDIEARELTAVNDIIEATLAGLPLVSRTAYTTPAGADVTLEYPIKTMNVNARDHAYQTDTGPIIIPCEPGDSPNAAGDSAPDDINRLELAFAAHNGPNWIELIINQPTPLVDEIQVHHYSKSIRLDNVRNTVYAID